MSVKIHTLEVENVKRIKAVSLTPAENGLTVLGGNNGQGKTSVLDAICWALGGKRYMPTNARRDGAYADPHIRLTLSNGLIVERAGKNAALKVIDPQGRKSGQTLLDSFVSELALDLPRFLHASDKEKADTLLRILGVGDELARLEANEKRLYDQRHTIGQMADRKRKHAAELPFWQDVPETPVSAAELIAAQQDILARNGMNAKRREAVHQLEAKRIYLNEKADSLRAQLDDVLRDLADVTAEEDAARQAADGLTDEPTDVLEQQIAAIDTINAKVRDNLAKAQAEQDAADLSGQYDELTEQIEAVRAERRALLDGADLPLPGLTVEDGRLLYDGKAWDCMSGAEQLQVGTAIVRRLDPGCGFILLDKLEQMDVQTLTAFGRWLEAEGLQAIATRVSTGDECSVIIEDGRIVTGERDAGVSKTKISAGANGDAFPRYVPGWQNKEGN